MKILKANALISKLNLTDEEWRAERQRGIGGSDAASIVGLNPYQSLFTLYAKKLGLIEDIEDNERMRQGRDLEEYVAKRFEEKTGKKTRNCNYILQHPKHKIMLANVDRLVIGESAGLECKVTSELNMFRFKNIEFPEQYYAQCVHYLATSGADRWYLAVLILGVGFEVFVLERDEEEIALLIKAEQEFWEGNVLKKIPPSLDGTKSTKETLSGIYPQAIDANEEIELVCGDAIKNLIDLKAQIKLLEAEETKCENIIKAELGENLSGVCGGNRVKWSNSSRQDFKKDLLKESYPELDLSPFYVSTNYRRLTLSKVK